MAKTNGKLPSTNGVDTLHVTIWTPDDQEVVGVVQISHGMIEYIDRYDRFARFLNEHGYVVVGNDHLGHGQTAKNEEELGYMNAKDPSATLVHDLKRVSHCIKKRYPSVPFFLLGHSMGSFLARRYASLYGSELDGLLLLGTGNQSKATLMAAYSVLSLLEKRYGSRHRSRLMEVLAFGPYQLPLLFEPSLHAWVTRDDKILDAYDHDPFCTFLFTLKGYRALFDTLRFIEEKHNIDRIPKELSVYITGGSKDPVGHYGKDIEALASCYRNHHMTDVTSRVMPFARHELLNELQYELTQEEILAWLQQKTEEAQ